MEQKIVAFDTLRIFCIIAIIVYHCASIGKLVLNNGYLAVECFFILSGYFLCVSYYRLIENNNSKNKFLIMIKKRFLRLYPSYFFMILVTLILMACGIEIQHNRSSIFDLGYNLIMFGDIGTVNNIIPGSWYVGALFWGSFLFIGLLSIEHEKTFYFLCPLIFIFSTVILYQKHTDSLGQIGHIYLGFLSGGILRALAGISCGMIAYYVSQQKAVIDFVKNSPNLIYSLVFIILMSLISYLFVCKPSHIIYNIYFLMISLVILLACRPSWGFSIFGRKYLSYMSNVTYMVFLSNIIVLEILKNIKPFMEIRFALRVTYAILIIFICAFLCDYTQKWLFAKLKNALFVKSYFVKNKKEYHGPQIK